MTLPQICNAVDKERSTVQVSIRTIRNSGVSQLNLSDLEKKLVQTAINEEIEILLRQQPKFKLSNVSEEFRKKVL